MSIIDGIVANTGNGKTRIIEGLPFGDYCKIDAINNSSLKKILRSPKHYKEQEPQETKALVVGHAAHTATLEPHLFNHNYVVFGENLTKTTKEGKAEWNRLEATGKTILRHKEAVDAWQIASATILSKTGLKLLVGRPELTVITELHGVLCKARFDNLYNSESEHDWFMSVFGDDAEPGNYIVDLKTTEDASPKFEKSIVSYGYDMQDAFYTDVGNAAGQDIKGFIFVVVESAAPYAVGVYMLTPEWRQIGREKYQHALDTYAECCFSEEWPGYSPKIVRLAPPAYVVKSHALKFN